MKELYTTKINKYAALFYFKINMQQHFYRGEGCLTKLCYIMSGI